MESPTEEEEEEENKSKMIKESLLESPNPKGGLRTIPFIIVNEAFERVASYGLMPNMIMYLMNEYHMEMASGSNILYLWTAATNFTPIIGAYFADSYVGRFRMIGFGSILTLLGMVVLWLTTMIPQARPPPCNQSSDTCSSPMPIQLIILCSSFVVMSFGAGGVRSSSLAFGADQLGQGNNLKNLAALESYLNWYNATSAFSVVIAMTFIAYIQENMGWEVGFGVPVLLMFLSAVSFLLASPFYVKLKANTSLLTGYVQVIVASYKNRHLELSSEKTNMLYHHKKGSMMVIPSDKLRFFNKACIIREPQQDLTPDGKASDPWALCTVDHVEELKTIIKVIPLWLSGVLMSINTSQNSFGILQANSMDRHLTSTFEIPAASFSMFMLISLTLWVALYDRLILPLASKIMGRPAYLSVKQRMGIGLFISFLSMVVRAIVEAIRRTTAIKEGYADDPHAVLHMSAFWLAPQSCLSGLAEALNVIGQNEFYMSEFPRSMASIASVLPVVGMSVANLLASAIMTTIDDITRRGGGESWVSSNINKGHYDYYSWVLAGISFINIFYFLVCSWAYGPCEGNWSRGLSEEDELRDE